MLILAGALLFILPIVLLAGALISFGLIDFKHINFFELSMGLGFLCFGFLFTYAICGSFSPIKAFQSNKIAIILPFIFCAAGVFLLIKGCFHHEDA